MASCEGERDTEGKHTEAGGLEWLDLSLVWRLKGMTRRTSGPAEEAF